MSRILEMCLGMDNIRYIIDSFKCLAFMIRISGHVDSSTLL